MPSAASTTRIQDIPLSRSARLAVNCAGMCCTISTGTSRAVEKSGMTLRSACGPPVDVPMTMASYRRGVDARATAGRATGGAGIGRAAGGRPTMLSRTATSLPASSRWIASRLTCVSTPAGLRMKSKAPSIRAVTVVGAPSAVRLLTMITRGASPRCFKAFSTSMPSIPGICTSSVTASGLAWAINSMASKPLDAVPTTSTPGIIASTLRIIRR